MVWVIFVAGAVLSWGAYGALLHMGQTQLANPLKALLCVGVAYFLIGVLLPVGVLGSQGQLSGFGTSCHIRRLLFDMSIGFTRKKLATYSTLPFRFL